jgi:hypothetical protein
MLAAESMESISRSLSSLSAILECFGVLFFDRRGYVGSYKNKTRDNGYGYLEVCCLGCKAHQAVALDIIRRPKTTPVHELERYMRCKDCSQVRGYPFKQSQLIALRPTKISVDSPASEVWPGERD